MINFNFNIKNPFSRRWQCLYSTAGITPIKHKCWEFQVDKCADIIGFEFSYTTRQDHAGLYLSLALFGYDAIFNLYDNRHWNHEKGRWFIYGGDEGPV